MTGVETAKDAMELIERVPGLKVNWDPANSWVAGEHPLEGYSHIRGYIANIHCKDADTRAWRERNPFVAFGDGLVPWEELVPVLLRDPEIERLTVEDPNRSLNSEIGKIGQTAQDPFTQLSIHIESLRRCAHIWIIDKFAVWQWS